MGGTSRSATGEALVRFATLRYSQKARRWQPSDGQFSYAAKRMFNFRTVASFLKTTGGTLTEHRFDLDRDIWLVRTLAVAFCRFGILVNGNLESFQPGSVERSQEF